MVDALIPGDRDVAARGGAYGLQLAAAPIFGVMALLTALSGGDGSDMLCRSMHGPSILNGMIPMYLLMCAFHLAPWITLIARLRPGQRNRSGLAKAKMRHRSNEAVSEGCLE